ncbi:protoheme IX farnesyltransferase, partial [Vibrio parahaemolyticus V-223/04]
NQNRRA